MALPLRISSLRTLDDTSALTGQAGMPAVAPFERDALDRMLRGGLPRGHLSEIVGPPSSGRTSLAWSALAAATRRGEWVALVDTFDRLDPAIAAACGIDLSHLLWVRGQALSKTASAVDPAWVPGQRAVSGPGTLLERTVDRAIKSLHLIAQSGVCTLVVLDVADVPPASLSRLPPATWLRIRRVVEGSETAIVLLASAPLARSAGGWSIRTGHDPHTGAPALNTRPYWQGTHDRARRLGGVRSGVRAVSPRGASGALVLACER